MASGFRGEDSEDGGGCRCGRRTFMGIDPQRPDRGSRRGPVHLTDGPPAQCSLSKGPRSILLIEDRVSRPRSVTGLLLWRLSAALPSHRLSNIGVCVQKRYSSRLDSPASLRTLLEALRNPVTYRVCSHLTYGLLA